MDLIQNKMFGVHENYYTIQSTMKIVGGSSCAGHGEIRLDPQGAQPPGLLGEGKPPSLPQPLTYPVRMAITRPILCENRFNLKTTLKAILAT